MFGGKASILRNPNPEQGFHTEHFPQTKPYPRPLHKTDGSQAAWGQSPLGPVALALGEGGLGASREGAQWVAMTLCSEQEKAGGGVGRVQGASGGGEGRDRVGCELPPRPQEQVALLLRQTAEERLGPGRTLRGRGRGRWRGGGVLPQSPPGDGCERMRFCCIKSPACDNSCGNQNILHGHQGPLPGHEPASE